MNSRDFKVQYFYEWKSKRIAAVAAQNINAAFRNGSLNKHTIQRWYANFEAGDESLTNEDRSRPETVVNNEVL